MKQAFSKTLRGAVCLCLAVLFVLSSSKEIRAVSPESSSLVRNPQGASIDSMRSSYIEDRRVWENLPPAIEQEYVSISPDEIHFPRILLDSEGAAQANREIETIIQALTRSYLETYAAAERGEYGGTYVVRYSVYEDESILSLLLEYDFNSEDIHNTATCFTFTLPDGKLLSDHEIAQREGFADRALSLMEETVRRESFVFGNDYDTLLVSPKRYAGLPLIDLWDKKEIYPRRLYYDTTGRLSLLADLYTPAGSGIFPVRLPLDVIGNYEDHAIDPIYRRMANALQVDPQDASIEAFVIYLGNANEGNWDALRTVLHLLFAWEEGFADYNTPAMMPLQEYNLELAESVLLGQEFYLLVPRLQHTVLGLHQLDMTEAGDLAEIENAYNAFNRSMGPTLVIQNISDIMPNAEVSLRYRDSESRYRFFISLQDGSFTAPEGLYDASGIFQSGLVNQVLDSEVFIDWQVHNFMETMWRMSEFGEYEYQDGYGE